MTLTLLLLFAVLNFMDFTAQSQKTTTDRTQAVTQANVGLDRMVREIRQAASFKLITSQIVEIVTPVRPATGTSSYAGNLKLVRYDCTSGHCVRFQGPKDGPLPATGSEIFSDVNNADIFSPTPNFVTPTFIGIKLNITVRGHAGINLTDGVNMRNQQFGG